MPQMDVGQAARVLGISKEAVRKRLQRGTLEGEKVAGQWRVHLEDTSETVQDDDQDSIIKSLQGQITDLQRRLDRESELREEENRRRDVILQQMTASIRLLTGPDRDVEVAQEARQKMDSRRPWWRFWD